jgi:hypothetical protein
MSKLDQKNFYRICSKADILLFKYLSIKPERLLTNRSTTVVFAGRAWRLPLEPLLLQLPALLSDIRLGQSFCKLKPKRFITLDAINTFYLFLNFIKFGFS